jgi:hypothetical protein
MNRAKAFEQMELPIPSDQVAVAAEEAGYALTIAGVYQDGVTQEWARQNCRRATLLAGEERVQNAWYDVHSLSDPGIFLEAVHAALKADVIVVSVYAADELPLDLYVWIQAWLPRRLARAGALSALIGVAQPPDDQFVRTLQYLQAVASRGRLDFVQEERMRPVVSAASASTLNGPRSGATTQALQGLCVPRFDA